MACDISGGLREVEIMVWLVLVEEYKKRKKIKDEICENMMIDILVKDA